MPLLVLLGSSDGHSLILIEQSDFFIIKDKAHPAEELMDNPFIIAGKDPELLEVSIVPNHLLLQLNVLVILLIVYFEGELVGVIVQVDEAVIEEEPVVAFLPITIIDLLTSFDVFHGLDDEALSVIGVTPGGLSRPPVVEHVSIGHKPISLHPIDLDPEDSAGDHVSELCVLFDGKLNELWDLLADQLIIFLNVIDLLSYLVQEGTPFQPLLVFLLVEHWKAIKILREHIEVRPPD
mmetsp:Transcript_14414/g.14026  ORF Transcript_14414/g.14026 Transcript_14414/m.14026 type:complete len:236 (-) Transcript_14414:738-1445(-)